jgi:aspartyl-tRNA(Asn)/glutamyl-tRNA(Gln) amidotransferase subunit A
MLFDGHIASASSKILKNYKATYDSGVVSQLKKQGVVFLGRTNMDEFAMGSSTETSAYGNTKNPLNTEYVPGGSSGGAVSSVAMNGALVSLGSDTGGSIRQPAAFTGLVGLKPSYGTVSRFGIISMGSSLDQVGPFGKSVRDVEILFNAINDYDEKDSTSIKKENRLSPLPLSKKLGVPRSFLLGDGTDKEIIENFEESCNRLKNLGYEIVDVSLPLIKYSLAVYYIICPAEVSSNLARYDGIRYGLSVKGDNLLDVYTKSRKGGFGKEVERRILLGTYILSHGYYDAYYNTAIKVREAIKEELTRVFLDVDAIITPTSPVMPFRFGDKVNDPISMYLSDLFSVPANITGVPAISIPSGKNKDGLPFSLHIMAPFLREDILFTIGKDFENSYYGL